MIGLTPTLALTAAAIDEMTEAEGRPPSPAELAWELDMSRGHVAHHLKALTDRGWLTPHTGPGRRALVLLHRAPPPPDECPVALTEEGRAFALRATRHG